MTVTEAAKAASRAARAADLDRPRQISCAMDRDAQETGETEEMRYHAAVEPTDDEAEMILYGNPTDAGYPASTTCWGQDNDGAYWCFEAAPGDADWDLTDDENDPECGEITPSFISEPMYRRK